jgi:hypothetical protein
VSTLPSMRALGTSSSTTGVIAQALGGTVNHDIVNAVRGSVLTKVRRGEVEVPRVRIVSANPSTQRMFPHHEVVTVEPGREEALERASFANAPRVEEWHASRAPGRQQRRREW